LAAVAACLKVGLELGEIQKGLESFPGLAHRMEQVGRKGNVLFINDSKATNADAAAPALSSFQRIYWIAGGLAKEGGIEPLRSYFPRIAKAYLIGEAAPAFSATRFRTRSRGRSTPRSSTPPPTRRATKPARSPFCYPRLAQASTSIRTS